MGRRKCPVFVVGFPRSGTTLLYHILLSSGAFAVYLTESHVFTRFIPRFGDLAKRKNRERMVQAWLCSEYFARSGLKREDVEGQLLADCRNGGDFLRIIMEHIARRQNVPRWAEKTPVNLMYLEEIKRTIPNALFVHMIRDGRDVALSMDKQNWVRTPSFSRAHALSICGLKWEWMVEAGMQTGSAFSPDYMEIRFEDLVKDPRETVVRLGRFIDQDIDYNRIRDAAIGVVCRPNSSFSDNSTNSFDPINRWRSEFPPKELARFESLVGRFLVKAGYGLSTPKEDLSHTIQLRSLRALYRAYFSLRFWLKSQSIPGVRNLIKDSFDGVRKVSLQ